MSTALAYAAFVLVGVNVGASGVLLPEQITDYGVDKATIGLIFFTSSWKPADSQLALSSKFVPLLYSAL